MTTMRNRSFGESDVLHYGDHLSTDEFMRRWNNMPHLNRAELIDGRVYMPSPVGIEHGVSQSYGAFWLTYYESFVPQCQCASTATVILSKQDVPQPDVFLRWRDGSSKIADGFIHGAPELIIEVSHSTVAYDLFEKLDLYCRSGVKEYVVTLIKNQEVRWLVLNNGVYKPLPLSADGLYRSTVFPGLWLDPVALLNNDTKRLREVLDLGLKSPEFLAFANAMK